MTKNYEERPFRTLLILGVMFGGLYLLYLSNLGDSDTKFHVYYESGSDEKNCAVTITNKDTGEVVMEHSLDKREGLVYSAKDAATYEIKVSALEKVYEVNVYRREVAGGTKDVLIYINEGRHRSDSDKVWLTPVFYMPEKGAEAEAKLEEYAKQYPEYEYSSTYNELPVRVDYGFSDGVPTSKSEGKEVYYVMADKARLNRIDRVSKY